MALLIGLSPSLFSAEPSIKQVSAVQIENSNDNVFIHNGDARHQGHQGPRVWTNRKLTPEQMEIMRLREENKRLKMELALLLKRGTSHQHGHR